MSGSKLYRIEYLALVRDEDIPALPKTARDLIKTAIEERLMVDPVHFGKPLRYSLKGHRRLRISDYRVIYRVEPKNHLVVIVAIKHRKKIYDDF